MKDVDVKLFRNAPHPSRIRIGRHAFIKDTGGRQGQGTIHDVGMTRNPTDIRHAPVDIFRMDILIGLGCSRDVGQVATRAVLASLGFACCAARVHQEKRGFGIHDDWINPAPPEVFQHIVQEIVASLHHGLRRDALTLVAAPDEDLVDFLAFLPGNLDSNVRTGLVIHKLPAAIVAIGVNHDAASGVRRTKPGRFSTESAKDDRVDDAQPRAGQHRDRQLRDHRHMNRHAIAGSQSAEVPEHRGHLVHAREQLLVSHRVDRLVLRLGNKYERSLIFVLSQISVYAVVTSIQFPAHIPFPERRIARVQSRVPILIPGQQVRIFPKTFGKMFFLEPLHDGRVHQVRLSNELRGRIHALLFLPMDGNLRLAYLGSPFDVLRGSHNTRSPLWGIQPRK